MILRAWCLVGWARSVKVGEWTTAFTADWVIWVDRVPKYITRIIQNNFGFSKLISELVIGYFGFGYFRSGLGISSSSSGNG